MLKMEKDDQGVDCLSRSQLIFTTQHDVAIWDLAVLNISSTNLEVWLAEDSGKITQLNFASDLTLSETKTVHQFANESALSVSMDILRLPGQETWATTLTIASNSKVIVLEKTTQDQAFTQLKKLDDVSDNVSCMRTIYDSESKQIVTLFATYNGRLTC